MFKTSKQDEDHLRDFTKGMQTWAEKTGLKIFEGVYFTEQQMKDIVNLKPAPGDCAAVHLSAGKCESPLTCMPTDPRIKEAIKAQEAARKTSRKN